MPLWGGCPTTGCRAQAGALHGKLGPRVCHVGCRRYRVVQGTDLRDCYRCAAEVRVHAEGQEEGVIVCLEGILSEIHAMGELRRLVQRKAEALMDDFHEADMVQRRRRLK